VVIQFVNTILKFVNKILKKKIKYNLFIDLYYLLISRLFEVQVSLIYLRNAKNSK